MKTVAVFGAGATKDCGGPLTNEILPKAIELKPTLDREGFIDLAERFLIENFHLPTNPAKRRKEHYPSLPLLLSIIDKAIDHRHALKGTWQGQELVNVRDAIEYATFALLEHMLVEAPTNTYYHFLNRGWPRPQGSPKSPPPPASPATADWPAVISLNYDIVADNAMAAISDHRNAFGFADYGCDIAVPLATPGRFGTLLKLHGSLNWLYCPGCERLTLGIAESGRRTIKMLEALWQQPDSLEQKYSCHGAPCSFNNCGAYVRPVMITPTHAKDYRNPHISQVWYRAERLLRDAERVIIVGYGLPDDDVDVAYLLKRSLSHLDPKNLTVVEKDDLNRDVREHPVGYRYAQLFGPEIDWRTEGFGAWLNAHAMTSSPAFERPLPRPRGPRPSVGRKRCPPR